MLHPAWHFTLCTLHIKLNKQDDNIKPWCPPFPIWNQSVILYPVLTVAFLTCIQISQETGKEVWYKNSQNLMSKQEISWNIFSCFLLLVSKGGPENPLYFCIIDYAKTFDCVDHNKLWKILKEMGLPDHLTCLLWNLYAGQETTIRTEHGTTDWFQGKGVFHSCILSPCLLIYMQSTSREMLGWMKHKLESRLLEERSTTSDMQMTPPLWQKVKKN